jgi:hypothetical protein
MILSIKFAATNLPQFLRVIAIDASGEGLGPDPDPVPDEHGHRHITPSYVGKRSSEAMPLHAKPERKQQWRLTEGYLFWNRRWAFPTLGIALPVVSTDNSERGCSLATTLTISYGSSSGYFSI